jgi:membrane protease YdiL (CAAX protease family)
MNLSRAGYIAAALLPLLYNEVPDLIVRRWYWRHGKAPMPPVIADRAVVEGNIAPYVALIALGASLSWLIRSTEMPLSVLGMRWTDWPIPLLMGILAGSGWLALSFWIVKKTRPNREKMAGHYIAQRSLSFWLPLALVAPFVEELWRSFCLVALAGHGPAVAVVVTGIACGWGHAQSRGRAISALLFGICAAGLFLWTRSLWATVPAHLIVNIGTLALIYSVNERPAFSPTSTPS